MHSRSDARAVTVALSLVLFASTAAAQGEGDRIVFQDTVVVRSTKLQFHLKDLATSATILSPLDLRRSTSPNLQDPLSMVPGVHVIDLSGSGTQGVVESRGFASQGFSSHTLVLIDEMPVNDFEREQVDWNLLAPAQVDRIEFLRGPASFLYGNPSMSGVVNLVTRGARAGRSAWFQGGGGSEGRADGMGGITWGGERASGGLSGSHRRVDGYRDHSEWRATSGYGFVRLHPAQRTTLRGHFLLQREDQEVPGPLPAPAWKDDPTRSDTPRDKRDTETFVGAMSARERWIARARVARSRPSSGDNTLPTGPGSRISWWAVISEAARSSRTIAIPTPATSWSELATSSA